MILLKCECGKTLQAPDGVAARKGKCPTCGRVLLLPASQNAAVAAAAPATRPVPQALNSPGSPGLRATLRGHRGGVSAAVFSPDGKLLATGAGTAAAASPRKGPTAPAASGATCETIVWDAVTGLPAANLEGHRDSILALAFSPDSRGLATASADRTVGIWDVSRGLWDAVVGVREHSLRGHTGAVTGLAWSSRALLASAGDDQTVRLWNTEGWQAEHIISSGRTGGCRLAFSPCGRYLAAVWCSRGPAIVWEIATRQEYVRLRLRTEEDGEDYGLAFSPDGRRLAVLSADELRVWDLSSCQVLVSMAAQGFKSFAAAPVGRSMALGGWETSNHVTVRVADFATGMELERLQGHNLPVTALAYSPDGRMLASGSRDRTINLWWLKGSQ